MTRACHLRGNGHEALEFINQGGVPPAAFGFVAHHLDGFFHRHRGPIRAIGGERVVDIDGLQDSRSEGDFVALETVGITRTVPSFMVVANEGENGCK